MGPDVNAAGSSTPVAPLGTPQGREQRVPCAFASHEQVRRGGHMTWNLDRVCDRCREVA